MHVILKRTIKCLLFRLFQLLKCFQSKLKFSENYAITIACSLLHICKGKNYILVIQGVTKCFNCHYMHSLEILKTLPSLIFFVRNLATHGRFTLSGQIFNSHILVVVENEDLKGAIEITQMAFQ